MADMAVRITGIGSSDPFDALAIDFIVTVSGTASGWSGDCLVAFDATADDINAAVRGAAVTVAANHSVTVTSADVQRVFGGAVETVS